jgi:hypothetical protein
MLKTRVLASRDHALPLRSKGLHAHTEGTMPRSDLRDAGSKKGGEIHHATPTMGRVDRDPDMESTAGEIVNFVVQCLITMTAAMIGKAINGWEGAGWALLGAIPLAAAMGYMAAVIVDRR